MKSLPIKVQILPYISQMNDRLANSLLSSWLALNGYISSSLKGSKLVPKFRLELFLSIIILIPLFFRQMGFLLAVGLNVGLYKAV